MLSSNITNKCDPKWIPQRTPNEGGPGQLRQGQLAPGMPGQLEMSKVLGQLEKAFFRTIRNECPVHGQLCYAKLPRAKLCWESPGSWTNQCVALWWCHGAVVRMFLPKLVVTCQNNQLRI